MADSLSWSAVLISRQALVAGTPPSPPPVLEAMVKNQCYTHVPVSGSKRFGGSRVRAERLCGCSEGGDGNSGARSVASVGTRAIGACLLTRARWRQSC